MQKKGFGILVLFDFQRPRAFNIIITSRGHEISLNVLSAMVSCFAEFENALLASHSIFIKETTSEVLPSTYL